MRFLFIRTPSNIPTDCPVLGIEIPGNRPDILDRCTLGNIDPQHGGSKATGRCAALETALAWTSGGKGVTLHTVLVTPRVDLDAIAAMALLQISVVDPEALDGLPYDAPGAVLRPDIRERLRLIDRADTFTAGAWPGPRPLPTPESPWPQIGGAGEVESLAAPNWVCGWATPAGGSRLTLEQAVQVVGHWLLYGESEGQVASSTGLPGFARDIIAINGSVSSLACRYVLMCARQEATAARVAVAMAIQAGTLPMRVYTRAMLRAGLTGYSLTEWAGLTGDGAVLVYTDASESQLSTDSSAGLAYCLAPVSIIRTREGRFSIAAFDEGRVDFPRLKVRMNELEPGWGGPVRMCSSPMGRASTLTPEQVLGTMVECLFDNQAMAHVWAQVRAQVRAQAWAQVGDQQRH